MENRKRERNMILMGANMMGEIKMKLKLKYYTEIFICRLKFIPQSLRVFLRALLDEIMIYRMTGHDTIVYSQFILNSI